ncbi:ABC transporter substrate-binding protein [Gordonia insulae]|uniref:Aliphatic sulfonates-binding protein n=1 Tax=Gordonia insulae TaxID=2420509 RepID=A0A3G8JTE4_9ACTN|nr:ABC transporter substrate-binding protein [Gordonia insulae]AZG48411.1 Putative aliphatic sulfonates-binding protein [Gordonia insulae]
MNARPRPTALEPTARTPKRVARKPFLTLLTALVVTVGLAACSSQDGPELNTDVPLPTDIPAGTTITVADQQNQIQVLLRASGLEKTLPFTIEYANFTGGPAVLEAFRAGTADVAPVGDVPPIHAASTGQQVPIILGREIKPSSMSLATRPGAPAITSLQDLRGKKIAYAEGTAQQVVVLRALANAGLSTDDVELVRLQLAEFSEALGAKEVDVAPLNEPRLTRYLRDYGPDGASFVDPEVAGTISQGLSYVYARGESLAEPAKAAALRALVTTLVQAFQWTNTHPAEWIKAYYVDDQKVSEADGWKILQSNGTTAIPALDDALIARQQSTIDLLEKADALPEPVTATDLFDLRFAPVVDAAVKRYGATRTPEDVTR